MIYEEQSKTGCVSVPLCVCACVCERLTLVCPYTELLSTGRLHVYVCACVCVYVCEILTLVCPYTELLSTGRLRALALSKAILDEMSQ